MIQAGALEQQARCSMKINHDPTPFEGGTVFRTKYGATSSGDNQVGLAA